MSAAQPRPDLEQAGSPLRTRLLSLLGAILLGAMAGGAWLFLEWEPRLLPIRMIEVEGELHHHSSQLLQETISARLDGGILTANLITLKRAAEGLPWVGRASIRRVWPDRLQVRVQEHRPIARWNGDGLVTAEGVVFRPRGGTLPAGLPLLEGEDRRAPEVVARYFDWREDLMLVGHLIESLSVDPRGDWRVKLVMGTELRLGTSAVEQRLARFIASSPQLEAAGQPVVVDLRYSNGFSVTWAPGSETGPRSTSDRATRSGNRG